jgi:hypothetical protein
MYKKSIFRFLILFSKRKKGVSVFSRTKSPPVADPSQFLVKAPIG